MAQTIFTLDARDNILLEFIKERFKLDENGIYVEINNAFNDLLSILVKKKINYQDLKHALIPSERNEIALVFDRFKIETSWYGLPIMSAILPLLDKNSSHSVLVGDYIGDGQKQLDIEFFRLIQPARFITYRDNHQYYIVYINNLSDNMVNTITNNLVSFNPYVGYFDLTYASVIKTYLSSILIRLFLKTKLIILQSHPDDVGNDKDENTSSYPFEDLGYRCKSVQSMYYGLFLSYKIERQILNGFKNDTIFSINAITDKIFDITEFKLLVEERKFQYLLQAKADNLNRSGISTLTIHELENLIKEKLNSNYIYNLTFLKDYATVKFDLLIETTRSDNNKPFKLNVGLEYRPSDKTLRLITMF